MEVRFGNISVLRFEQLIGVDFNDSDFIWMNKHHSDRVRFGDDKLHIFEAPFGILAGHDIADELIARLKKYKFEKAFYVQKKESEGKSDS